MGLSLCVLKWLDLWSRPLTLGIAQTSLALLSLSCGLVSLVRFVRLLEMKEETGTTYDLDKLDEIPAEKNYPLHVDAVISSDGITNLKEDERETEMILEAAFKMPRRVQTRSRVTIVWSD